MVIRLLIADDQDLMREGLRMMLSAQPDIEVVAEARNGRDAVEQALLRKPDVALLDVRMPGIDGIDATRRLQSAPNPPRVLILTTFDHDDHVYDALRAGATGFLLKTTPPDRLVAAVRGAAEGESLLSPEIARRLADRFARGPRPATAGIPLELEGLTARELDVLRLIARGLTNSQIAGELVMSGATVKSHVNRIFRKLDLTERAQAVVLAYETGFGPAGPWLARANLIRSCPEWPLCKAVRRRVAVELDGCPWTLTPRLWEARFETARGMASRGRSRGERLDEARVRGRCGGRMHGQRDGLGGPSG